VNGPVGESLVLGSNGCVLRFVPGCVLRFVDTVERSFARVDEAEYTDCQNDFGVADSQLADELISETERLLGDDRLDDQRRPADDKEVP